eukprot:TRINITY_DN1093_c0_g2_i1.p1 TRINITY_DN1093_c0_g2~~TRINITY_DN1093_c0_g2_i1.p1  ORF type:complete len:335 (-),score=164.56 TRINITY_DN1093_c0_g2_i1:31-1035(-)
MATKKAVTKREGHGKYGWGKAGTGEDGLNKIDQKDPNYDSEQEGDIIFEAALIQSRGEFIARQYFEFFEEDEVLRTAEDLTAEEFGQLIKKLIVISLDKSAYERELTSQLLAYLRNEYKPENFEIGFIMIFNSINDLKLDIPNIEQCIANYIFRALSDEVIVPAFINNIEIESQLAKESIRLANAQFNDHRHRGERIQNIWGPGTLHSVKKLKEEIKKIIGEYITIQDKDELANSVRALNAPSFHWQIVKQTIRVAIENINQSSILLQLLYELYSIGLLSLIHIEKGFYLNFLFLNDLKLDIPRAEILLNQFTQLAKQEKILSNTFQPPQPKNN